MAFFDLLLPFMIRCSRGHLPLEETATLLRLDAYLLGLMNSAYLATGGHLITEARLRASVPDGSRSRFGTEHWSKLVDRGFAEVSALGWSLTTSGASAVAQFHAALRDEIARWPIPSASTKDVQIGLSSLAGQALRSLKASLLRELWAADGRELVLVYRSAWEVVMNRHAQVREAGGDRVAGDDAFFAGWPRGESLAVLRAKFQDLSAQIFAPTPPPPPDAR